MADPRQSVAFALETGEFASGEVDDVNGNPIAPGYGGVYYTFPPGVWISFSNEFKAESIFATGSKLRETQAYGPFSGSVNIHFLMDYDHTEFLDLIFDKHTIGTNDDGAAVPNVRDDNGHAVYEHTWRKNNATFIKPFVIRVKRLNRIANSVNPDAHDEAIYLKGCVAKSIEFNRNQQGSQMEVRIAALFADMEVQLADLDVTDYTAYTSPVGAAQYSCMFLDEESKEGYVRDVDSHSVKMDIDTSLVYNTCTPFATAYFEGQTHITWDAKTFANDPEKKFQLRPFSGGYDAKHLKPMAKGLMPMENAFFTTYNLSMRDQDLDDITDAIDQSPYLIKFHLVDSTINAMSWPDGEGEKITDALQSVETTELILTIRNIKGTKTWGNKIALNNGRGGAYEAIPIIGVYGKLRPEVTVNDIDVNESSTSYTMAEGAYVVVPDNDITKGKAFMTGVSGESFSKVLEDWIIIPYNTALYDVQSGAPATLQALFELSSDAAAALVNSGLSSSVNWVASGTTYVDDGDTITTADAFYPRTTLSGTLGTAGTYKYYIVKAHLIPTDDDGRQLVIDDHGILRVDIEQAALVAPENT